MLGATFSKAKTIRSWTKKKKKRVSVHFLGSWQKISIIVSSCWCFLILLAVSKQLQPDSQDKNIVYLSIFFPDMKTSVPLRKKIEVKKAYYMLLIAKRSMRKKYLKKFVGFVVRNSWDNLKKSRRRHNVLKSLVIQYSQPSNVVV